MSGVPEGLRVKFTQFDAADSLEGQDVEVPWSSFVAAFCGAGFYKPKKACSASCKESCPHKKKVPLMVPVEFVPGATRKSLEYVDRIYIGALDFDGLTEEQLEEVLSRIVSRGLEAIYYTTWGHAEAFKQKGLHKFRVLLPLLRPVEKGEWKLLWPLMNGLLGSLGDPSCFDPTRGYFVPAAPKGTKKKHLTLLHLEGEALDVNQLLSGVDTLDEVDLADVADVEKEKIDRERIHRFAKRLGRSSIEYRSWMGELLQKVLKGEPFAEKGSRDNTVYKLAQDLGEEFPEGDAGSIAQHFEASLSHMGGRGAPTVADVREKIQRAQRSVLSERMRKEKTKLVQDQKLREELGDYDKSSILEFCKKTNCGASFDIFSKRLIVQKGARFFVYCGSTYVPFTEKELTNACRDLLKPAAEALNVSIYNVSEKNGLETPKSPAQLVHDYGVVAQHEEVRIYEQASFYEESTKTIVEAPFPLRHIVPKRHPEVDEWIDRACGVKALAEALRDWMAVAPDLQRALAFLVFSGKTGLGKTSFAAGIARLWSSSDIVKTSMANAFDQFNTEMRRNPVLLADEELPTDYRGRVPTGRLRALVSSGEHMLNAKNQAIVRVKGYYRLIATLNNLHKLSFGQAHSREDVEAIQQRTLVIPLDSSADGLFDYHKFVTGDALAEHALWLHKTRERPDGRFGISNGANSDLFNLLQDEIVDGVLRWVLWFLENRKLEDEQDPPAFVANAGIYVHPDRLHNYWQSLFVDERKPSKKRLSQSVILLSDGYIRIRLVSGATRRYYKMDLHLLRNYAVNEGHSAEFVSLQLLRHTEQLLNSRYVKVPKSLRLTEEDRQRKRFAEKSLQQLKNEDPEEDGSGEEWA